MESAARDSGSTLRDYLRVLRLRKWVVLLAVLLVPAAALAFSFRQDALYRASADVLVKHENLPATISGIPEPYEDPVRSLQTQVDLAKVPSLAKRVLAAAGGPGRTPEELLLRSEISAKPDRDLLNFQVTDPNPELAVRLTNEYARQFTIYVGEIDTEAVRRAREEVEGRIRQLGVPRSRNSPLQQTYAVLVERREQLRTMEALQTSNASLVRPAHKVEKVQPRLVRNGAVGLGVGVLFGIGLAFFWHALDTRIRSAEEVRDALELPLLARIPEPPRHLRKRRELAMLAEPNGIQAEAFRILRTNLEFVNLERRARTIMFTSAVEGEGKSTTVVNLAVAFARVGRRVVLLDLDLRRPFLHQMLGLEDRFGLTDVALGHVALEEALASVAISDASQRTPEGNGSRPNGVEGVLEVLTAGPPPPNAGEFVGSDTLAAVLAELRQRADLVLIDTPPLLHVGDAMTLSAFVDALVVVIRLKMIRRHIVQELQRVLDTSPAEKLGFVQTGAGEGDSGYGRYYYYYDRGRPSRRAPQRVSS
jgi:succinoglycan biosynthesis transport protein ExoP